MFICAITYFHIKGKQLTITVQIRGEPSDTPSTIMSEIDYIIAPRIPRGLAPAVEGLAREILRQRPRNIYAFAAQHFAELVELRDKERTDEIVPRILYTPSIFLVPRISFVKSKNITFTVLFHHIFLLALRGNSCTGIITIIIIIIIIENNT